MFAQVQHLESRQLLSATTVPTDRLNTAEKVLRHLQIHEQVNQSNAEILLIGDSITQRWETQGEGAFAAAFGDANVINMGIGGDQTQNLLWRLQDYNLSSISPKLAILNIGTNNICHPNRGNCTGHDSPTDTAAGVKANLDFLREALPGTPILLLGIFPRDPSPGGPHRESIRETNHLLAEMADEQTVHFVDLSDQFVEADGQISAETMFDFLHLTDAGYEKFAAAIVPAVKALVAQPEVISISGTNGDDSFSFFAEDDGYRIRLNGKDSHYDSHAIRLTFDGLGGNDVVRIEGSQFGDHAVIGTNAASVTGVGYQVSVTNVETKTIVGGDGFNSVQIADSNGDDRFVANPHFAFMNGDGFYSAAVGFTRVVASASTGHDIAELHDSPDDDLLVNKPGDVYLRNDEYSYFNYARDFDYVKTRASVGDDRAQFYDSPDDDFFVSKHSSAYMRDINSQWFHHAEGFDSNRAFSVAGGIDEAQFFDSPDSDTFVVTPTNALMRNSDSADVRSATGFSRVMAYSRFGGNDVATMFGDREQTRLRAAQESASMISSNFLSVASGFAEVQGYASETSRLEQEKGLRYLFTRRGDWTEVISI